MKHYNPSISEDALRQFKLKTGDMMPDEIAGPVATLEVTPIIEIVRSATLTDSVGPTTVYTVPSDKKLYIRHIIISGTHGSANTGTYSRLLGFVNGVQQTLAQLTWRNGEGWTDNQSHSFQVPLVIDPNTALTIVNENATATIKCTAIIFGYLRD